MTKVVIYDGLRRGPRRIPEMRGPLPSPVVPIILLSYFEARKDVEDVAVWS